MSKQVFYQPILSQEEWESGVLSSFMVYRDLMNAKVEFPKHQIAVYFEGEIEDPTIVDDEDFRTATYVVDIPNEHSAEWINVAEFKTREEAIDFAQSRFGADENGMISLISEVG
jgi:hypothetical protein